MNKSHRLKQNFVRDQLKKYEGWAEVDGKRLTHFKARRGHKLTNSNFMKTETGFSKISADFKNEPKMPNPYDD